MKYAVVIEKAKANHSAYVPDLPVCIATGATLEEVETEIQAAIEFHLEGLRRTPTPPTPVNSIVMPPAIRQRD